MDCLSTTVAIQALSADGLRAPACDTDGVVRPFEPEDVPAVADLYVRVYLGNDCPATAELRRYVSDVFLTDPWRGRDTSPSLVHESRRGAVTAFLGAHPRRFRMEDREIRAVAMGQLMVDPNARRSGIARRLGRAMLAGPQTLTFGTTASVEAARLWRTLGFWNPAASGMTWRRVFERPSRYFPRHRLSMRWVSGGSRVSTRAAAVRPMMGVDEWTAMTRRFSEWRPVSPMLDDDHARWIWTLLDRFPRQNRPEGWVVDHPEVGPVGWWVGTRNEGLRFRVLDLAFVPEHAGGVAASMFEHGAGRGWTRMEGVCTSPSWTAAVVAGGGRLHAGPAAHVYHAVDPRILWAVQNADALVSELHSESWLCFRGAMTGGLSVGP